MRTGFDKPAGRRRWSVSDSSKAQPNVTTIFYRFYLYRFAVNLYLEGISSVAHANTVGVMSTQVVPVREPQTGDNISFEH